MPKYDLIAEIDKSHKDEIWHLRGLAMDHYAMIEQQLCRLLATLLRTRRDIAGIVFFRIVNTRSRNDILTKLLRKRHKATYTTFWNSVIKHLIELDGTRNHIVHWHSNVHVLADGPYYKTTLTQPNYWDRDIDHKDTLHITNDDLRRFIGHCINVIRHLEAFNLMLKSRRKHSWHSIFQQELVYPLPKGHPLYPRRRKPESQPPPSPE